MSLPEAASLLINEECPDTLDSAKAMIEPHEASESLKNKYSRVGAGASWQ